MPIYMQIGGIEGESTDKGYEKWFKILSFSWGESNPGPDLPQVSSFNVMLSAKKGMPSLFLACAQGTFFNPQVTVSVVADTPQGLKEQYRYLLENVFLESLQTSHSSGEALSMFSLSLNFSKMTFIAKLIGPTGIVTNQTAAFDFKNRV